MELFTYIPFVPDKKTVLRRLGSQRAQFPAALEKDIDAYLAAAQALFSVTGKAIVLPLGKTAEGYPVIAGRAVESAQLGRLLAHSREVYLMCTSIPARQVKKISEAFARGEGVRAIVLDAYASEAVDGALDVVMARKNEALRRTGQKLTRHRFSAGYGDLDISYQRLFYDLLDMGTLDVTINEKYLLSPEKSVIAVAGVET